MQNDVMGAISKAQGAFDQAIGQSVNTAAAAFMRAIAAKLGELGDDEHKEATLLLQVKAANEGCLPSAVL